MSDHATDVKAALRDAENKVRAAESRLTELKSSRVMSVAWSAVAGFLLFAVGAHWFPGYQLDSTADRAAKEEAVRAVSELMAQICAERFVGSPDFTSNLEELDKVSGNWEKASYIRDGSWAVSPNGDRPDIGTAERCSDLIARHIPVTPKESS